MSVVIDASVALKWVLDEEGSLAARQVAATQSLLAPDLMFIECANVLAMKARRGLLTTADAAMALSLIDETPIRALSSREHVGAAQTIAFDLGQSAYGSLYLAVALAQRSFLVTADDAFARAALVHPVYGRWVRPLAEWSRV